jgi:hypothetical protein
MLSICMGSPYDCRFLWNALVLFESKRARYQAVFMESVVDFDR